MKQLYIISFFILFIFSSCSSTLKTSSSTDTSGERMKGNTLFNPRPAIDLTDHLRKFSGVIVTGQGAYARINIRTNKANPKTVYFVDGKQMYNYQDAYGLVSGSKLHSIKVLKDAGDLAFYGVRGADGIVEIKTLKE